MFLIATLLPTNNTEMAAASTDKKEDDSKYDAMIFCISTKWLNSSDPVPSVVDVH